MTVSRLSDFLEGFMFQEGGKSSGVNSEIGDIITMPPTPVKNLDVYTDAQYSSQKKYQCLHPNSHGVQ